MPETGIGFFPDAGGSYFLPRLPHCVGFYLGLAGAHLNADDCLEVQLIDYKISQKQLPLVTKTLAETPFAGNGMSTVTEILKGFQLAKSSSALRPYFTLINDNFAEKQIEKVTVKLKTRWFWLVHKGSGGIKNKITYQP